MMRYPADAKMHIIAYVFALAYYIVAPLSLIPSSFFAAAGGSGSSSQPDALTAQGWWMDSQAALQQQSLGALLGDMVQQAGSVGVLVLQSCPSSLQSLAVSTGTTSWT